MAPRWDPVVAVGAGSRKECWWVGVWHEESIRVNQSHTLVVLRLRSNRRCGLKSVSVEEGSWSMLEKEGVKLKERGGGVVLNSVVNSNTSLCA